MGRSNDQADFELPRNEPQNRSVREDVGADAQPWQAEIREFDAADRKKPPRPGSLVFVGSSTIRLWDLKQSFPGYETLNRGFGGSQMSDVVRYMDRIVIPYRPRAVVLYEGDNDIASGKKPEEVFLDFKKFAERLFEKLPVTQLVVISIKPSPARWEQYPQMQEANARIRAYCEQRARCHFVEIGPALLDATGQPNPKYYVEDRLHLNAEGYARCAKVLEPYLTTP